MAYDKVPKACADAPVGFQTVNSITSSLDSLKTDLEIEHTEGTQPEDNFIPGRTFPESTTGDVIGGGGLDQTSGGHHNHPLIPRGVAWVGTGPTLSSSASTAWLYYSAGVLTDMRILDTGTYFFPIGGFSKVWGKVTVLNSGVTLARKARVVPAAQAGLGTGLLVYTYEDDDRDAEDDPALIDYTGDFVLSEHVGFYLVAFGRREIAPVFGGFFRSPEPVRRRRFPIPPFSNFKP